jgi:hypothetical protein
VCVCVCVVSRPKRSLKSGSYGKVFFFFRSLFNPPLSLSLTPQNKTKKVKHQPMLDVDGEIAALAAAITRLGTPSPDGATVSVPFGVLFRETADECEVFLFVCFFGVPPWGNDDKAKAPLPHVHTHTLKLTCSRSPGRHAARGQEAGRRYVRGALVVFVFCFFSKDDSPTAGVVGAKGTLQLTSTHDKNHTAPHAGRDAAAGRARRGARHTEKGGRS